MAVHGCSTPASGTTRLPSPARPAGLAADAGKCTRYRQARTHPPDKRAGGQIWPAASTQKRPARSLLKSRVRGAVDSASWHRVPSFGTPQVVNPAPSRRQPPLPVEENQVVYLDDQLAAMIALRDEGKIGAIGLSSVTLYPACPAYRARPCSWRSPGRGVGLNPGEDGIQVRP